MLRAFPRQPLILHSHHDLLRDGPDALGEAAAAINRTGSGAVGLAGRDRAGECRAHPGASRWNDRWTYECRRGPD